MLTQSSPEDAKALMDTSKMLPARGLAENVERLSLMK